MDILSLIESEDHISSQEHECVAKIADDRVHRTS